MIKKILSNILNNFKTNEYVFTEIYEKNKWHSSKILCRFDSGLGSSEKYAIPYVDIITKFIKKNKIITVCDLGCGDFRVGKLLVEKVHINKYIGIDVVKKLVLYNNKSYANDRIVFKHKDIVHEILPHADLYLIRQVLQHISNGDIQKVLKNIPKFSKLVVTEHQFINNDNIIPNKNKIKGSSTRISKKSAVYLDKSPFNYRINEIAQIKLKDNECLNIFEVFI